MAVFLASSVGINLTELFFEVDSSKYRENVPFSATVCQGLSIKKEISTSVQLIIS